jgi:MoxR-like ATPase
MALQTSVFQAFHEAFLPFVYAKESVARSFEIALLMRGHILVEDYPGIGKTTASKAFAKLLGFSFARVQGTSDTLPQDILGGEIYDPETRTFRIRKGPIFQEILLVDEINRMHPKTQSAFLQGMEERAISLAGLDYELPRHHLVIATQNPVEHGGTFPLPEAQKDRFACLLSIGYPPEELEKQILSDTSGFAVEERVAKLDRAIDPETLSEAQAAVRTIHLKDRVLDRLLRFVAWSRDEDSFAYGLSPRGVAAFTLAMRARAFLCDRDFVLPEDGRDLVEPFLAHRLMARGGGPLDPHSKKLLTDKYAEFL